MGYNRIEANPYYGMVSNPPYTYLPVYFDPPFNTPSAVASASLPLSLNAINPDYNVPTAYNWSFDVQRALTNNMMLSVAYVGSREIHMDAAENFNQPLPADGYEFPPQVACTTTTPYPCTVRDSENYLSPYKGFSSISMAYPLGSSIYHSLQAQLNKRFSHGLMFGTAYTWSKAEGYIGAGGYEGLQPQNIYDLAAEYGFSEFDRTQMLTVNYVYELPFFHTLKG
jgi:hypothetical protein